MSGEMTEQFVAFFDLLGFQDEMVKVSNNPDQAEKLLSEFQTTVAQTVRNVLVPPKDRPIWNYRGFTDNFVIALPVQRYDGDDSEGWFGIAVLKLAEFQYRLALQGWFVRGGLTMGKFFMDDLAVFGPALVDAYLLESKFARDPRIILSNSVLGLVRSHLQYYGSGFDSPQNESILIDADGRAFVNYLHNAVEDREPDDTNILKEMNIHKAYVEDRLLKHRANPVVWAKYRWVASYHDYFCDAWLPESKDVLRISREALAASPSRLVQGP